MAELDLEDELSFLRMRRAVDETFGLALEPGVDPACGVSLARAERYLAEIARLRPLSVESQKLVAEIDALRSLVSEERSRVDELRELAFNGRESFKALYEREASENAALRAQLADRRARDVRIMADRMPTRVPPTEAIRLAATRYDTFAAIAVPRKGGQ